eukprot:TRINITY_DN22981_c0_g1_i1.p1 TRINITY_DN22981_c0_g1~~TRINITY_DN22981_c0_g1_i1.p1  ORF type:complete len:179 (+),score=2.35 TRINITY_DN22981_c0_g1_i1:64-600(+)
MCIRDRHGIVWTFFPDDINLMLLKFVGLISKGICIEDLDINVGLSALNDEGCLAIAQVLRLSQTISRLTIWMHYTNITDFGTSYLMSKLPLLPLKHIHLSFHSTQITDQTINALSQSLNRMQLLREVTLFQHDTHVSDLGVHSLVDSLSNLPCLSRLIIDFQGYYKDFKISYHSDVVR